MPREIIKKMVVYKYDELSEKAKEKALESLGETNINYEWWDAVYEDAENIGVKIEEFELDRGSFCRGKFVKSELDVAENILKEYGKDCKTYKDAYEFVWDLASEEDAYYKKMRSQIEEDEYSQEMAEGGFDADYECPDLFEEFRQTIFEDYRMLLQKDYDYLTSKEAIEESIRANEYEFTENGRIYR